MRFSRAALARMPDAGVSSWFFPLGRSVLKGRIVGQILR